MSISFSSSGSFDNTERFLRRIKSGQIYSNVSAIAQRGTNALRAATPVDSGATAAGWNHEVQISGASCTVTWTNSNTQNGFPVAIMLQYGHGTGTGGYVRGRDYINPAIRPVFKEIADAVWREVTRA